MGPFLWIVRHGSYSQLEEWDVSSSLEVSDLQMTQRKELYTT